MTDLVVALFVAILVVAALNVPRWGDALGRFLRRDRPGEGDGAARDDEQPRR